MCPARPENDWDHTAMVNQPIHVICMSFARPGKDWNHIAIVIFSQPQLCTWALRPLMLHVCTRMIIDCHPFAWLRIYTGGGFRWSWGDFLVIVVFSENDVFWWNFAFRCFIFGYNYIEMALISLRRKDTTPMLIRCISPITLCISDDIIPCPMHIRWYHPLTPYISG